MAIMLPFDTDEYMGEVVYEIEDKSVVKEISAEYPTKFTKSSVYPYGVMSLVARPIGYAFGGKVHAMNVDVELTIYDKKIRIVQTDCDSVDAAFNALGFEQTGRTQPDRNGDNMYFITLRYNKIINRKEVI